MNKYILILFMLLSPNIAEATKQVLAFPSNTPITVCQPSDPNSNCGVGSINWSDPTTISALQTNTGWTSDGSTKTTSTYNVGIGSTSPRSKLDVDGSIYATSFYGSGAGLTNLPSSSGTPGGSTTQIQYNNAGTFGGVDGFIYSGSTLSFTGNIGVGSTIPTQKLDVNGSVKATSFIGNGSGLTGISSISGLSVNKIVKALTSTTITDSQIYDNGTYVGIGTTNPASLFHINHSGSNLGPIIIGDYATISNNTGIYFRTSGSGYLGTNSALGNVRIMADVFGNTNNGITVKTGGNVGINTTVPVAKLNIVGTGSTTGTAFEIDNSLYAAKVTVLDNGNVGIATTAPTSSLEVGGAATIGLPAATTAQLTVKGGSGGNAIISLQRTSGSTNTFDWALTGGGLSFRDAINGPVVGNFYGDNSKKQLYVGQRGLISSSGSDLYQTLIGGTTFATGSGTNVAGPNLTIQGGLGTGSGTLGDILFDTGVNVGSGTTAQTASTKLIIKGSGNVGIGTTAPTAKLHITASGSTTGTAFEIDDILYAAKVTVLDNGNVGIGTTVPGYKLHVDGSIYAGGTGNSILNLSAGNVGIGTSVTRSKLTIDGAIYSINMTNGGSHGAAKTICLGLDGMIYSISSGTCY